MADLEPSLDQVGHKADFQSGKAAFNDATMHRVPRFGNDGGCDRTRT